MPWEIGLVQAPDLCPWVTWQPSTTLVSGGNNPLNIYERTQDDPGSFDISRDFATVHLPSYEGPTFYSCREGCYVLNLDWSVVNAMAQDMQDWGRSTIDFDDPGEFRYGVIDIGCDLGPIYVGIIIEYSLSVVFSPLPGSIVCESWTVRPQLSIAGVTIVDDLISVNDCQFPSLAPIAYPGVGVLGSTFCVRRTADGPDGFGNYTYTYTSNAAPTTSSYFGNIGNENNILFYGGYLAALADENGSVWGGSVASVENFVPTDLISSASYRTGPGSGDSCCESYLGD